MLARKGRELSVSTVGRIIEGALEAGAIRPASFCEGRVKPKRRRRFAKMGAALEVRRQGHQDPGNWCNALQRAWTT